MTEINSIYALYGMQPSVKINLKNIPFMPAICGVKVFCFFSPSFLEKAKSSTSSKNGKLIASKKMSKKTPVQN